MYIIIKINIKTIRREKRLAEKKMLGNLEKNHNNPQIFFKKCKAIRQDYKPQTTIIKNDNDDLLTGPTKLVEQFRKYFDELLNNSNINGNRKI